ncbi:MAG: tRNA preQ1(34) S-adenosylmethionine ribosyltransferase-isomerase QueA [Rickettsiales bacterium]|nr:tRNA preQ1(34) S-adenosylmethionine ribosyltransferase-isomerase QueA [Rickettsiales bacterium]
MKTALFDFTLPESLIASQPAEPRDSARMLVVGDGDSFFDHIVRELPAFLKPGDVMVFNDTRVMPARLIGRRGAAGVEVLLHKQVASGQGQQWLCFAKPAKKLKPGDSIVFGEGFSAEVLEKREDGQVVLSFAYPLAAFREKLAAHGQMPLPPYIEKLRKADASDHARYQTVYAKDEGSVAAPTAGLHYTPELLAAIDAAGVQRVHVTLHVGGGTFLPVKAEDTSEHVMHSEYAVLTPEAASAINAAKAKGGRVVAVGTTSLRTLESAADEAGVVHPFDRETAIFITPGYRFRVVDALLTNFHLPKSTLFMLVSAFCGLERMKAAYAHAIEQQYRFYSYGDTSLLMRG